MQNLISDLRAFKLSGMAFSLEERLIYVLNKLSYKDLLELLCEDEKALAKTTIIKGEKMLLNCLR